MEKTQIPNLPPISSLDGDEQIPLRDVTGDVRVTPDQLASFVLDKLTPEDVLNLVKFASPQINGLNSQFLGSFNSEYYLNAANLNTGTIRRDRLPQGEFSQTYSAGGQYPNSGTVRGVLKLDQFILGGPRIMVQMGWTPFIREWQSATINFKEPFVSGFSGENKPVLLVTPECRSNEYPGIKNDDTSVELDIRVRDVTLNGFTCASKRTSGSGTDTVSGHYIAIGYY